MPKVLTKPVYKINEKRQIEDTAIIEFMFDENHVTLTLIQPNGLWVAFSPVTKDYVKKIWKEHQLWYESNVGSWIFFKGCYDEGTIYLQHRHQIIYEGVITIQEMEEI